MEGFGAGLIHPLITAHHLLLLLALGMLTGQGQQGQLLKIKVPMLLFVPLSGLALFLTTRIAIPAELQLLILCAALCAALLLAASLPIAGWAFAPAFALAALALGLDSGVRVGAPTSATATTLVAIWISLNVCIVNIAFYTSLCPRHKWVQIGFRVAGSWIAAICAMVLAFALKTQFLN